MVTPFPGMDPYLEAADLWPDLHQRLITYAAEVLQPQLRPRYVARISERVQLAGSGQTYVPDVAARTLRDASLEAVANQPPADEPVRIFLADEPAREPFIEIVLAHSGALITLIEFLSLTNKRGDGRRQYLRKQRDLLGGAVNLVEVDLLREGDPTALSRRARLDTTWRYTISVSRAEDRAVLELVGFGLQDRLPRCRIPLRAADDDVILDLPAVFSRAYAAGGYDLLVDYSEPPATALTAEEAAWVDAWLRDRRAA